MGPPINQFSIEAILGGAVPTTQSLGAEQQAPVTMFDLVTALEAIPQDTTSVQQELAGLNLSPDAPPAVASSTGIAPNITPAVQAQTQTQIQQPANGPVVADALAGTPDPTGGNVGLAQPTIEPVTTPELRLPETNALTNVLAHQVDSVRETDGIQEESGGIVGALKAGAFKLGTDPVIQDQLSQIVQALTAKSPSSFAFQLGSALRESAQGQQVELAKQATIDKIAGREPTIDPSTLTLAPALRLSATQAALGEVRAASDLDVQQAGIQTPEERQQQFDLNEAKIQATSALTQQRNLETLQTIQNSGVQDIKSVHLSTIDEINKIANIAATQAAGIQGVTTDSAGNRTYQFKNPTLYEETYNKIRDNEIQQAIAAGVLPKSAAVLQSGTSNEVSSESPEAKAAVAKAFPNATYKGTKVVGDMRIYLYDTTGDGKADQQYEVKVR